MAIQRDSFRTLDYEMRLMSELNSRDNYLVSSSLNYFGSTGQMLFTELLEQTIDEGMKSEKIHVVCKVYEVRGIESPMAESYENGTASENLLNNCRKAGWKGRIDKNSCLGHITMDIDKENGARVTFVDVKNKRDFRLVGGELISVAKSVAAAYGYDSFTVDKYNGKYGQAGPTFRERVKEKFSETTESEELFEELMSCSSRVSKDGYVFEDLSSANYTHPPVRRRNNQKGTIMTLVGSRISVEDELGRLDDNVDTPDCM